MKIPTFKQAFLIAAGLTLGYEIVIRVVDLIYALAAHTNLYWHIF